MNVADPIVKWAEVSPDGPALIFNGREVSYGELKLLAAEFAMELSDAGVSKGDRVCLILSNCLEFIIAYYATQFVGGVSVSISPLLNSKDYLDILVRTDPKVVVYRGSCGEFPGASVEYGSGGCKLVDVERIDIVTEKRRGAGGSGGFPFPVEYAPDDLAAILYTSGTTGRMKGVCLSAANVVSNTAAFGKVVGMNLDSRILLVLPLHHCFAQNVVMNSGLCAGATLVLAEFFEPNQTARMILENQVSMLFGVPAIFSALLGVTAFEWADSLGFCLSGAAPLKTETAERWKERFGINISIGYGATETSPYAACSYPGRYRMGSLGTPGPGVEMRVVGENGEVLDSGDVGEIEIRGDGLMLGYWKDESGTKEALNDGWFRTGDLGKRDEDGFYFLVNRLVEVVNVGGLKVYPAEVEAYLDELPGVQTSSAFSVPVVGVGENVAAAVIAEKGKEFDPQGALTSCKEGLASYKVPTDILVLEEFPVSVTGKVDRSELRELFTQRKNREESFTDARSLAQWIEGWIQSNISGGEAITSISQFHDAGLSSIDTIALAAALERYLGIDVPVSLIWEHSNPDALAGFLARGQEKELGAQRDTSSDKEVESLSDEELESLIRREIERHSDIKGD